jgi:hypothetical protein
LPSFLRVTLACSDWKRSDFRTEVRTEVCCRWQTLDQSKTQKQGQMRAQLIAMREEIEQRRRDADAAAFVGQESPHNPFMEQYNHVLVLHPSETIGFDLDEIMDALYGHVTAGGAGKNRKKGGGGGAKGKTLTTEEASAASANGGGDDGPPALPDVVYNKRLTPMQQLTGLPMYELVPKKQQSRAEMLALSVASGDPSKRGGGGASSFDGFVLPKMPSVGDESFSAAEMQEGDGVADESALALQRRTTRLKCHVRTLPIYLFPQFLFSQRISVLKSNRWIMLCHDLLRAMEIRVPAYIDSHVYVDTLRQFRANFYRLLDDVQARYLVGEQILQRGSALEHQLAELHATAARFSNVVREAMDTVCTTKKEANEIFYHTYIKDLIRRKLINADGSVPGYPFCPCMSGHGDEGMEDRRALLSRLAYLEERDVKREARDATREAQFRELEARLGELGAVTLKRPREDEDKEPEVPSIKPEKEAAAATAEPAMKRPRLETHPSAVSAYLHPILALRADAEREEQETKKEKKETTLTAMVKDEEEDDIDDVMQIDTLPVLPKRRFDPDEFPDVLSLDDD